MLFRCIKSIIFFSLLFASLRYLGVAKEASFIVSLIPLILGFLNILVGPAFGLAALVFSCAALSALLPAEYSSAADFVNKRFNLSLNGSNNTLQSAQDKLNAK